MAGDFGMSPEELYLAIEEQFALHPVNGAEQEHSTDTVHFVPGSLDHTYTEENSGIPLLSEFEIAQIRKEARDAGVWLPQKDDDLQVYVRNHHAEKHF